MKHNTFTTLISPNSAKGALVLNQDTTFVRGIFDEGQQLNYTMNTPGNGAYVFALEGSVDIENQRLNKRDALGIYDTASFSIRTLSATSLLIIEVPMQ